MWYSKIRELKLNAVLYNIDQIPTLIIQNKLQTVRNVTKFKFKFQHCKIPNVFFFKPEICRIAKINFHRIRI